MSFCHMALSSWVSFEVFWKITLANINLDVWQRLYVLVICPPTWRHLVLVKSSFHKLTLCNNQIIIFLWCSNWIGLHKFILTALLNIFLFCMFLLFLGLGRSSITEILCIELIVAVVTQRFSLFLYITQLNLFTYLLLTSRKTGCTCYTFFKYSHLWWSLEVSCINKLF